MKRLITLVLLLATFAGFGQITDEQTDSIFSYSRSYKNKFVRDGGTMHSDRTLKNNLAFLELNDLYEDTRLIFVPEAAIKYREEGSDKLLTYGYDFSRNKTDVSQTTALLQPYISGCEDDYTWGVNSAYGAYVEHPDIVINSDHTVISATFALGDLNVHVNIDTVSTGTLNSVEWAGDLFYYRIHDGLLSQSQIDAETEWLQHWILPVDEANYQGLEWTQKSATGYTRLGTISDIPISQSAGDANLPIQSQMKRCLLLDNGTVNYFIDADDPIQKNGDVTYTATGTASSTVTETLVDATADFITAGVQSGMAVRNTTTGKICVIYDVISATQLSISRDYFTLGDNYQIGTANYGGADGQVMVQIPKFYLRHEYTDTKIRWAISLEQLPGFQLHPAFFKDGVEVDYRYYSAFEGSMYDASASAMTAKGSIPSNLYATGDLFCSVAGQWAKTNEKWYEYDEGTEARGAGWRNVDFALNSAVQLLYLIEYADFDTQNMIGAGRTGLSGDWEADSYIGQTGYSIVDGNSSNSVRNGGTAGQLTDYMSYRGVENWYGNVWKDLSLIAWDGTWTGEPAAQPVYWTNDISKRSYDSQGDMTLLTKASYIGTNAGYQDNVENQFGFIPQSVGSISVVEDYYYQYSESGRDYWRLVPFGGRADFGGMAGGFTLTVTDRWASAYVTVGGRVCF